MAILQFLHTTVFLYQMFSPWLSLSTRGSAYEKITTSERSNCRLNSVHKGMMVKQGKGKGREEEERQLQDSCHKPLTSL